MNYNYTIIIPHKNIPDLLQRCLDSIPERNDTQTIIVDDNSDPTIVDFENFPGVNNPNTEVIFTKESKGAGYARNIGLKKIRETKWVIFSDSDDFFSDEFNDILNSYSNIEADMVFFLMESVDSVTLEPSNRKDVRNKKFYNAINYNDIGVLKYKMYGPTTKFVSYKLIVDNSLYFDEVKAANDVMFSIKTGHHARNILTDERILYIATDRNESLVNTVSYEVLLSRFNVSMKLNNYLSEINKDRYRAVLFLHIYNFFKYKPVLGIKYLFVYLRDTSFKHVFQDIITTLKYKR